jgi:chemotaxis protein MotA
MLALIGIAIVLGSVITGYAMGKGNFHILFQPAEVIIIFGAAIGGLVISSPAKSLKVIIGHLGGIFADSHMSKAHYLELLLLMNAVFFKIKKEGLVVESDIKTTKKPALKNIADKGSGIHLRVTYALYNYHHELDNLVDRKQPARTDAALSQHQQDRRCPARLGHCRGGFGYRYHHGIHQ